LPITAVDSITPALEHTKQQLFQRFRIGQWTKLAFVGLLAGELGSNGCNRSNFHLPVAPGTVPHAGLPHSLAALGIDPALLAGFITAAIVASLAVGVILLYISSIMRFVLFDGIVAREVHIRWSWGRRLGPGWRFFVWKLIYYVVVAGIIVVVFGIPLAVAFNKGWLKEPGDHIPQLVASAIVPFLLLFVIAVVTAVILTLMKDFVVPQMALENLDAGEAWRRLWRMMQAESGAYVAYIVMKIVLAIVAAILVAIVTVVVGVFLAVPTAALSILAIITGKSAGLTWNAETITLAIVVGALVLGVFLYLVSLISVPAIVFFPAYSMYFFAGRYPRLAAVLYPAAPATQVPTGSVPGPGVV
jgi:hypothetical protein